MEMTTEPGGRMVLLPDTRLYVAERGHGFPLLVLHGGPGLDHHMFGDYLDPLAEGYRLILVDQRGHGRSDPAPEETWTLGQMALDVLNLAQALGLEKYAVLGHSYGAFVALENAVDFPGAAALTIVSSGIPSARFLAHVDHNLEMFEPADMREQVALSWAREKQALTQEDVASLLRDQNPFHFANPRDPRIEEFAARTSGARYAPDILRHFATSSYGGIEVEQRLDRVTQPVLVLSGRFDRTCSVEAAEAIAQNLPNAELVIFEQSGHMAFVEENDRYIKTVRAFLDRHLKPGGTLA